MDRQINGENYFYPLIDFKNWPAPCEAGELCPKAKDLFKKGPEKEANRYVTRFK